MKTKDLLGIAILACCWGTTFLFIKVLVGGLEPISMTFFRCVVASLTLLALCLYQGADFRPLWAQKWDILAVALLGAALPFALCASGEKVLPSSTAGIIEGTTPIFALLFSVLFVKDSQVSYAQGLGVFVGFLGVFTIFGMDWQQLLAADSAQELVGKSKCVLMAASFAGCYVYSKQRLTQLPALPVITAQLGVAALLLGPLSLIVDGAWNFQAFSPQLIFSLFGLAVWGTATGWYLYYKLIKNISPSQIALANYLCPVLAIVLGFVFLGENLSLQQVLGTVLVLISMSLSSRSPETNVENLRPSEKSA